MVTIKNEKDSTTKEIEFSGPVKELLDTLKVNPETVLVVKNSEVITEEEIIENKDTIEILSVISGG